MYYRVLFCLAPGFDQALVSGWFVTGCQVIDDRFVQLQTKTNMMEMSRLTLRTLVLVNPHLWWKWWALFFWKRFRSDWLNSCVPTDLSDLYLDDGGGQRVRDHAEQFGGILATLDVEGVNQEFCELVKNACRCLHRQKNQHRQPVEEVVDSRPSKSPGSRSGSLHWLATSCCLIDHSSTVCVFPSPHPGPLCSGFTCGTRSDLPPASWPRWCWWRRSRCWRPW